MRKRKNVKAMIVLIILTLSLTACSSKNDTTQNDLAGSDYGNGEAASPEMDYDTSTGVASGTDGAEEVEDSVNQNSVSTNRKLVRNISLELESLEFDSTMKLITDKVNSLGGYIEKSEIQGDRYEGTGNRYANLVIRVPSTEVDSFINLIDKNTYVVNKQESTEDITLKYVDAESHVKTLEIEQERLLALLEKAGKLEDIVTLEDRLSDVRYELENYASTLRTYDNLVEYSTVTVTVDEVVRITPLEGKSAWDRMGSGFKESIYNIRDGFVDFVVWLVVNIPYLIIWGIILLIIALIGIKANKKYKKITSPTTIISQDSGKEKDEKN